MLALLFVGYEALDGEEVPVSQAMEKSANRWIEPAAAILMALTTLATTWCSYQASRWNGQSSGMITKAGTLERKANLLSIEGRQVEMVQTNVFMQLMAAKLAGNEPLQKFYEARIGGEFKPAYEAWLAEKPFENPKAPPSPFVPPLYKMRYASEVTDAQTEAADCLLEADRTGSIGSRYLGNTIMLAAVLFFTGTSTRFDSRRVRSGCFYFGAALFLVVVVRLLTLPVAS